MFFIEGNSNFLLGRLQGMRYQRGERIKIEPNSVVLNGGYMTLYGSGVHEADGFKQKYLQTAIHIFDENGAEEPPIQFRYVRPTRAVWPKHGKGEIHMKQGEDEILLKTIRILNKDNNYEIVWALFYDGGLSKREMEQKLIKISDALYGARGAKRYSPTELAITPQG